jgi:hypothetical protein
MKAILLSLLLVASVSCKKDGNSKSCYECDMQQTGTYMDFGCYTKSEWDDMTFTDLSGNPQPKSRCRKK